MMLCFHLDADIDMIFWGTLWPSFDILLRGNHVGTSTRDGHEGINTGITSGRTTKHLES